MRVNTEKITGSRKGSLTIEASLVMPFFMFMIICLISLHALLLFQIKLKFEMAKEVKRVAMKPVSGEVPSLSDMSANISNGIGEYILKIAPIENGENGINYFFDNYGSEIICLKASYKTKLYYDLFNLFGKEFTQTALSHDFTGYGNGLEEDTDLKEEIYVYVTEDSEVYHTSRECTHIKLKITQIGSDELKNARNTNGGKYKSCEHCHSKKTDGLLFITPDGDKFHNSLGCSGLKRTVKAVPLKEVENLRCCSRCGG